MSQTKLPSAFLPQLHKQQTQAEPERHVWHRRESDESGESAPEEGAEGARAPQPLPRSASYPCATPRPGPPETTALHGGFQRRYGGITGRQHIRRQEPAEQDGGQPQPRSSCHSSQTLLMSVFFVSLDPGTVPRAPSHFSRLPLGGWAEDGQSASRHPEPVPEEGSEDELPPQVHKVRFLVGLGRTAKNHQSGGSWAERRQVPPPHKPILDMHSALPCHTHTLFLPPQRSCPLLRSHL